LISFLKDREGYWEVAYPDRYFQIRRSYDEDKVAAVDAITIRFERLLGGIL
jgi:hypothetical protein